MRWWIISFHWKEKIYYQEKEEETGTPGRLRHRRDKESDIITSTMTIPLLNLKDYILPKNFHYLQVKLVIRKPKLKNTETTEEMCTRRKHKTISWRV